jgi:hypothetical protein
MSLLGQTAVFLGAAVIAVPLFRRFGRGPSWHTLEALGLPHGEAAKGLLAGLPCAPP